MIALAARAGSLRIPDMMAAAHGMTYISPRGEVTLRGNQLAQDVYVAEAIGLEFEIRDRIFAA